MFLNSIYTDGYTCRISSARRVPEVLDEDKVNLEMADFNTNEVEEFFRTCFLDSGCKNAYIVYYGDEQVRSLTVNEYYHFSGSINRAREQNALKIGQGIKDLETRIPTTKTSSVDSYINHIVYVLTHLDPSDKWNNYYGRQCALEEASEKKYNRNRRKKTGFNRKKRKKMAGRRSTNRRNPPIEIR
ncbi:uncharacterized protein BX663DRAFT_493798 [Cokeromyces recurvatus]|uniref:uncharacterized protein n=1 Tax=Cokeromyces recurvatus TaxID=90255 RepID=UPI00221FABE1|nr:uncharacterized protein BX663DRAFT_493798 [Cokeromyces recurvatus]KAI7908321.1 hypothetical protein BX663DRAFT_493798 [Cokeromyces recurvatus]